MPQLITTGFPIKSQRYIQEGARPHMANVVLDFLNGNLGP